MSVTEPPDRLSGSMNQNTHLSSADRVYAALRADILSGRSAPGDVLSRAALAQKHGVSQTPVREALLRLEREGMVDVRAQSRTCVAPISVLAVHQAMFVRRALECEVVKKLAAAPKQRNMASIEDALDSDDQGFHRALFAAVGMGEVFDGLTPILVPLERYRALVGSDGTKTDAEHRDILARVFSRDQGGAVLAMQAHLASEIEALKALQVSKPKWFLVDGSSSD